MMAPSCSADAIRGLRLEVTQLRSELRLTRSERDEAHAVAMGLSQELHRRDSAAVQDLIPAPSRWPYAERTTTYHRTVYTPQPSNQRTTTRLPQQHDDGRSTSPHDSLAVVAWSDPQSPPTSPRESPSSSLDPFTPCSPTHATRAVAPLDEDEPPLQSNNDATLAVAKIAGDEIQQLVEAASRDISDLQASNDALRAFNADLEQRMRQITADRQRTKRMPMTTAAAKLTTTATSIRSDEGGDEHGNEEDMNTIASVVRRSQRNITAKLEELLLDQNAEKLLVEDSKLTTATPSLHSHTDLAPPCHTTPPAKLAPSAISSTSPLSPCSHCAALSLAATNARRRAVDIFSTVRECRKALYTMLKKDAHCDPHRSPSTVHPGDVERALRLAAEAEHRSLIMSMLLQSAFAKAAAVGATHGEDATMTRSSKPVMSPITAPRRRRRQPPRPFFTLRSSATPS